MSIVDITAARENFLRSHPPGPTFGGPWTGSLIRAIRSKDLDRIEELAKCGVFGNVVTFHVACYCSEEAFNRYISVGGYVPANIHAYRDEALKMGIKNPHVDKSGHFTARNANAARCVMSSFGDV